ncbi:hypothetical protein M5K25_006884 [Dendrobium thyrsiflorum]|uniref:Uncharacterized protein n=1 Tax=Dendrobium thyrsiflorum TaxID=117978 RepID=A0ABD0VJH7_DENTH
MQTLKDLDDHYINIDIGGDDLSVHRQHHQGMFIEFDQDGFDIGDDTFVEADFTSQVLPDTPPQVPQSPPPPQEPVHVDAMEHKQMEVENQPPEEVDQEQKIVGWHNISVQCNKRTGWCVSPFQKEGTRKLNKGHYR